MKPEFDKKLLIVERELKKMGFNEKVTGDIIIKLEGDYSYLDNKELFDNYFRLIYSKVEFVKNEFISRRQKTSTPTERMLYWRHKADFEKERIKQLSKYNGLTQALNHMIEESLNL